MKMNFREWRWVSDTKSPILNSIYWKLSDAITIVHRSMPNRASLQMIRSLRFLVMFNIRRSRSHRLYYGYIGIDIVCFFLDTMVQWNGEKGYNAERKINILYRSWWIDKIIFYKRTKGLYFVLL